MIRVGFFLRRAFGTNWVGEAGPVFLGIIGNLGLIGASEYCFRRYFVYSQTLAGGGTAISYLAMFAAFAFYGLIGAYTPVGLLLLISVAASALALRHDSVALALIGIFGAFLAPFIIGAFDEGAEEAFSGYANAQIMLYIIMVDVGVLALSAFRNWRRFTLLALVASLLPLGVWYQDGGQSLSLAISQGNLTAIFLIFVGATMLFRVIWRSAPRAFDLSFMINSASGYLGIGYGLL